jgi:hypothetical protein
VRQALQRSEEGIQMRKEYGKDREVKTAHGESGNRLAIKHKQWDGANDNPEQHLSDC